MASLEIGCGYLVDIAVHTIILDTRFYREFCDKWFGRFLDHIAEIDRKADGSVASVIRQGTRTASRAGVSHRWRHVASGHGQVHDGRLPDQLATVNPRMDFSSPSNAELTVTGYWSRANI
ncbi:hypothetical protein [Gandjariella thermophila]|uniref:Uncharacterized protein n=1 Tax=Gandjariella thermophila TaxID=1931992 RepID=A0A4D4J6Z3_9PSEU|nr:hypothetical protein [Gandjariella thermophila]GDY30458.1 hypothetical protein GTS_20910 [Gandjariella thermophila]